MIESSVMALSRSKIVADFELIDPSLFCSFRSALASLACVAHIAATGGGGRHTRPLNQSIQRSPGLVSVAALGSPTPAPCAVCGQSSQAL